MLAVLLLILFVVAPVLADQTNKSLLELKIDVIKPFLKENEPLRFIAGLINLGDSPFEVNLTYTVKDDNLKTIARLSDTRVIETTLSYVQIVQLPREISPGPYVLQVDAAYDGRTTSYLDTFVVISKSVEIPLLETAFLGSLIVNIILSTVIFISIKQK